MLWETLTAARDLGRLHDISSVLVRFGFGDMVRRLGMGQALEKAGRALHWKQAEELAQLEPPQRIRRALEELGPTFVKLGQMLATRPDLLPPDLIEELEKLQDAVPPIPFEELRPQLEEDLSGSPESVFAEFDTEPLAAASMAQVHRARLKDGQRVIVKIRRPGSRKTVEADLRLLARTAEIAELESPELRRYRPKEVVRQFTRSLHRELDLANEGRNAERMAENFKEDPDIHIPRVWWEWTSERINVQEEIQGIRGRDLDAVDRAGMDRKLLAKRGAGAVLKMILIDGFFHADPHPGNVFYLPGERVAFIDFGMVGRLSRERREQVVDLMSSFAGGGSDKAVEVLLDWAGNADVNEEALATDVAALIDQYSGVDLKKLDLASMFNGINSLLRDYQVNLPPDLTLLMKAFITLQGMGSQLDPEFDLAAAVEPYVRQAMLRRYAPDRFARRGLQGLSTVAELAASLPRDLQRLTRAARKGGFRVGVDVHHLERFSERLDRSASRLTMGIVTAALIIGSSIVTTVEGGPTLLGMPVLGLLGFLGAGAGGVWLLFSIWRSGRGS